MKKVFVFRPIFSSRLNRPFKDVSGVVGTTEGNFGVVSDTLEAAWAAAQVFLADKVNGDQYHCDPSNPGKYEGRVLVGEETPTSMLDGGEARIVDGWMEKYVSNPSYEGGRGWKWQNVVVVN